VTDNPIGLVLPLQIERLEEAVKVVDANGKAAAYFYICEERERRLQTNRLSPEEGVEVARICARALTDAIGDKNPESKGRG
jgi:uncharacterized protein (DUF2384 family)